MQLMLEEGLPFISMLVASLGSIATIDRVLVDSGSASTILAAHAVESVWTSSLKPERSSICIA